MELAFETGATQYLESEITGGKDFWGFLSAVGNGAAVGAAAGGVVGGGVGIFTGPGFIACASTGAAVGGLIGGVVGIVAFIKS